MERIERWSVECKRAFSKEPRDHFKRHEEEASDQANRVNRQEINDRTQRESSNRLFCLDFFVFSWNGSLTILWLVYPQKISVKFSQWGRRFNEHYWNTIYCVLSATTSPQAEKDVTVRCLSHTLFALMRTERSKAHRSFSRGKSKHSRKGEKNWKLTANTKRIFNARVY